LSSRPFRFGTTFHGHPWELAGSVSTPEKAVLEIARGAEKIGYSTLAFNDHVDSRYAPLIAGQAVADATTTLRVSQHVLNQDFRHPVLLAKEIATLDLLSGGRVQVGIGAGWMHSEYDQIGLPFDKASVRIERLEEIVTILKGMFSGTPFSFSGRHFTVHEVQGQPAPAQPGGPPLKIGGGGRKILSVAARHADIIEVMDKPFGKSGAMTVGPDDHRGAAPYEERIGWIKEAAGTRFGDIELALSLTSFEITNDPERAVHDHLERKRASVSGFGGTVIDEEVSFAQVMDSPRTAIGSLDEICAKLLDVRDRFGFNYILSPYGTRMEALAPVIERLSGT
jgi:probable F420-dependent oxidoreductase